MKVDCLNTNAKVLQSLKSLFVHFVVLYNCKWNIFGFGLLVVLNKQYKGVTFGSMIMIFVIFSQFNI